MRGSLTRRAPRRSAASRYVRSDTRLEAVQGAGSIWPSNVTLGRFAKAMMSWTGRQSREAFNGGIERDCCQPELKNGPSPTAADIGIGVIEGRTEISNIAAVCLAFQRKRSLSGQTDRNPVQTRQERPTRVPSDSPKTRRKLSLFHRSETRSQNDFWHPNMREIQIGN